MLQETQTTSHSDFQLLLVYVLTSLWIRIIGVRIEEMCVCSQEILRRCPPWQYLLRDILLTFYCSLIECMVMFIICWFNSTSLQYRNRLQSQFALRLLAGLTDRSLISMSSRQDYCRPLTYSSSSEGWRPDDGPAALLIKPKGEKLLSWKQLSSWIPVSHPL